MDTGNGHCHNNFIIYKLCKIGNVQISERVEYIYDVNNILF